MLSTISFPRRSEQQCDRLLAGVLFALVLIGAIYSVGLRLTLSVSLPLWLDETWSAMIATRESWPAFWKEAWLDCNPPFYYLFLSGWVRLFGDSNFMLRLPSSLFVIAAAMLPVIWRPRGMSKSAVWTFAALIILWPPNLYVMLDARGYGLMLFLSTASCLTIAKMLQRLTPMGAAAWVMLGTMMFMTHYYSAVLIVGQGLILLHRHRARLLRVWPTIFIAIPGFVWFAYHLPRLKEYARPDVAWYDATTSWSTLGHLLFILGIENFLSLTLMSLVAIVGAVKLYRSRSAPKQISEAGDIALAVGGAGIGFVIAIAVGMLQPSLAHRYFIPLVPSAMFALTLITQKFVRPDLAALILALTFLVSDVNPQIARQNANDRALYGYEEASNFVQLYEPDHLVFLWDHPATKIMDQHSLEAIGGYFMKRAGVPVAVQALEVPVAADPNAALRSAAIGKRPAIIWLYDTAHRSAAHDHPPTFERDPAWACLRRTRDTTRSGELGSVACVKSGNRHD